MKLSNILKFMVYNALILTSFFSFTMEQPEIPEKSKVEKEFICKGIINDSDYKISVQLGLLRNGIFYEVEPHHIKFFNYSFSEEKSRAIYNIESVKRSAEHCTYPQKLVKKYPKFMLVYKGERQGTCQYAHEMPVED